MSYYDEDPMYTGEIDPAVMEQQLIDYLVANGAGAGLLPQVQPSGKQMTVSNITGALSANRQGLFDTAFQGGFGGADAFAPDAFVPTVTTTIRQEPELQQVYSYLRSPTSMEGIITQELMLGGTPATAKRQLQQLLTASPEEIAAVFARYDQFFGREPSAIDPESIKTNLLLELPPALDSLDRPMPVEADGTGVNWDFGDDSVLGTGKVINELNAQIPRIGPSGPKWGTGPDGQPVQLSAGGELQWSIDETGAPVMIEVTETPSAAKTVFDKLGLPDPSEEYMTEDFLPAGWQEQFAQYTEGARPAEQEALQQWLTAQAENQPSWEETMTPYKEGFAPGDGPGPPDLATTRYGFPEDMIPESYGAHNVLNAQIETPEHMPGPSDYGGWNTANAATETPETMPGPSDYGGWNTANAATSTPADQPTDFAYGDWNKPGVDNAVQQAIRQWIDQVNQPTPANVGAASGGPFSINLAPAPTTPPYAQEGAMPANQPGGAGFQQGDIPLSRLLSNQTGRDMDAELVRAMTAASLPPHAQPGAQPANQPGGPAYMEAIETGERRAAQRQEDEQQAQVLGGSTDRTGKRVRPTRTGEQARAYRAAHDQYIEAFQAAEASRQRASSGWGEAASTAFYTRQAGIRPLDQAMMARRLVMMNAGMPQGI